MFVLSVSVINGYCVNERIIMNKVLFDNHINELTTQIGLYLENNLTEELHFSMCDLSESDRKQQICFQPEIAPEHGQQEIDFHSYTPTYINIFVYRSFCANIIAINKEIQKMPTCRKSKIEGCLNLNNEDELVMYNTP